MVRKIGVLGIMSCILLSAILPVEKAWSQIWGGAGAGVALPVNKEYKPVGIQAELAGGYRLTPQMAGRVGLGYYRLDFEQGTDIPGVTQFQSITSAYGALQFFPPSRNRLTPYFLGGLGIYDICLDTSVESRLLVSRTTTPSQQASIRFDFASSETLVASDDGFQQGQQDARETVNASAWLSGAFSTVGLLAFLASGRESVLSQTMDPTKGLLGVETGPDYATAVAAGGIGTLVGWGVGRLVVAKKFPRLGLDVPIDSPYGEAYQRGYRSEQRRIQSLAALIGGVAGTGVALLATALIEGAF